ncbi:MAG: CHASE2 domain-containing protein [Cyanobacteria bacterium P01_C01_bin.70]
MTDTWLNERYELRQPLGKGGFAKTYFAVDHQQSQAPCVIKQLMPANSSPQFLKMARRLFQAEVAVLRRLGSHSQIPALQDAFEADGEFYLVQEFIDGETLSDRFKQQPVLNEAEIISLLKAVLPVLAFIHQEQVIHRDIKPSNLMRRRSDGRIMLIDFGAVKEITTEVNPTGSEQFTVSIGTQGYAAPEQMAGRPRYSSDLYALGMTVIRGLTGRSPTELPEDSDTGELQWEIAAPNVSPGLQVFLQRLTKASIYQRYASATAALAELEHYEQLAAATAPAEMPPTTLMSTLVGSDGEPRSRLQWRQVTVLLLITALILLVRQLGGWVPIELWIHDQWVQRRSPPAVDDRLLVVEIRETDLMALQRTTPSDATLAQVIETLQAHAPQVIGLDLYRDIPQGEGHAELLEALAADNVVAIRQLGNSASGQIPAPRGVPPGRVGFNDFPVDDDGVVRRNLLFASADESPDSEILYSFALRLALAYLEPRDIVPLASEQNADYMSLNGTSLVPLDVNFGGYRHVDAAGYQVMLRYRGAQATIPGVSLTEVLEGKFEAEMIRDRIVIIGTTAASAKDLFLTPYSAAADEEFLMSGVMLHAHATSQILSAALDQQSLYWALPEVAELAWTVLWATGGVMLGGRVKRLWMLGFGLGTGSIVLIGVPVGILMASGWMPMLPAIIAFWGTAITTTLLRSHAATVNLLSEANPTPLP